MGHRTEQNGQADQVDDSARYGSSEEASQIGWGRSALVVAWLFLCVTALMGWMMRWHMVWPIPGLNYGNMLHGHSHTGFLGWVFNALFVFGVAAFAKEPDRRFFRWLFWVTQVPMAVMVVSFPMEGYGVLSIVVSTLHLVAGFVYAIRLMMDNRVGSAAGLWMKLALCFMMLSALGPLALGPIKAAGLGDSAWYRNAIYFYLHFQYNGWFLFMLIALAVERASKSGYLPGLQMRWALIGMVVGCVGGYAHSVLWMRPDAWVYRIAGVGAWAQLAGWVLLSRGLKRWFRSSVKGVKPFLWVAWISLSLKVLLQVITVFPWLSGYAESSRFAVLFYLHLVLLGGVTPMLLAEGLMRGWIGMNRWVMASGKVALGGFAMQQMLLLLPDAGAMMGFGVPRYWNEGLLFAATWMTVGVFGLGAGFFAVPLIRIKELRRNPCDVKGMEAGSEQSIPRFESVQPLEDIRENRNGLGVQGPESHRVFLWVFLVVGMGCLWLALTQMLREPEVILTGFWSGSGMYVAVLLIPGWLGSIVCLAAYSLFPAVMKSGVFSRGAIVVHLLLHVTGCYWMGTGALRGLPQDVDLGLLLTFAGGALCAGNLLLAACRVNRWDPSDLMLHASLFWLLMAGLCAWMMRSGRLMIPASESGLGLLHLLLPYVVGGFGWMGLLGLSLKLIPWLADTKERPGLRSWFGFVMMNTGLFLLFPAYIGSFEHSHIIAGIPFLIGTVAVVLDLVRMLVASERPLDAGLWAAGIGFAIGSGIVLIIVTGHRFSGGQWAFPPAEVVRVLTMAAVFGPFTLAILGLGPRIVPLLSDQQDMFWARRLKQVGLGTRSISKVVSLLTIVGSANVAAALFMGDPTGVRVAALMMMVALGWYMIGIGRALPLLAVSSRAFGDPDKLSAKN